MNKFTGMFMAGVTAMVMCGAAYAGLRAPAYDAANRMYRKSSSSVFSDRRSQEVNRISNRMYGMDLATTAKHKAASAVEPTHTFGPVEVMGDLDAPNGETWFYVGDIRYDSIPPDYDAGKWFTELILREYEFTIYNQKMEVIGVIKDKMRYEPDEVRAPYIDMAPLVSQKFYNTDEYYEFVVGVATNPGIGMVREHSFVYSLNKPNNKDEDGYDKPVFHTYSFIGDVLTISNKLGEERYLITTSAEHYSDYEASSKDAEWTGDPADSPFWKAMLSQKMTIDVYGNAVNDTDGPVKVITRDIPLTMLQGDQMNAPIVLSTTHQGKPYLMIAQYKDTFYNPYASSADEDVTMRQNNELQVSIYTQDAVGQPLTLFQQTNIPFTFDTTVDRLLAQYWSVGALRFRQDLDFDPSHYNNKSGKAYLTVAKQNYIAGSDDSYITSYYIYKDDGKRYKTIFTDSESAFGLSDIPGHEPQYVFVTYGSGYEFHFVDMLSVKEVYKTSNSYVIDPDEEPELLLANMDRTATTDGSYNYVVELRIPTVDENENDNIRAIWIDKDGSFIRIDEVNMGTNVYYAQLYLNSGVLKPGVYSTTGEMAYMTLIKRGLQDSAMQEELLVADAKSETYPDGRTLLECKPNEKGSLSSVMPVMGGEMPRLWVVYINGNSLLTLDNYRLPLDKETGIDSIVADGTDISLITFDGQTIVAAGQIYVYNINGIKVAEGNGSIDTTALPAGIYLAKAGEAVRKIAVK